MVIADHLNEDGVGWPSLDLLVLETKLNRETVVAATKELRGFGIYTARRRFSASTVFTGHPEVIEALPKIEKPPKEPAISRRSRLLATPTIISRPDRPSLVGYTDPNDSIERLQKRTTTTRRRSALSSKRQLQLQEWATCLPESPEAALRDAYLAARQAHPERNAPGLDDPRNTVAHATLLLDDDHAKGNVADAVDLLQRTFLAAGTKWMRDVHAFTLAGLAKEWTTLAGMRRRGDLR
jgi:hypothetical protein